MATQASSAIANSTHESTRCYSSKAHIVPPIAVLVDLGLPILLLTAFAVTFRFQFLECSLPLVLFALCASLSGSGGRSVALLGNRRLVAVESCQMCACCSIVTALQACCAGCAKQWPARSRKLKTPVRQHILPLLPPWRYLAEMWQMLCMRCSVHTSHLTYGC